MKLQMRTRLSSNITWYRYIFGALTIVLLYDIFSIMVNDFSITLRLLVELISVFITIFLFYYFEQQKEIEHDKDYLYLIKQKNEKKISLSQIKGVRITSIKINRKDSWKIDYTNLDGLDENVRFVPNKKTLKNFEAFKSYLKELNPRIVINNEPKF